jgi:hypothetical protein
MRKPAALATAAMSLALVAPASAAAAANEHASCSAASYSSLTGQPGARADIQFFNTFPDAAAYGLPPGALQSESSRFKPPDC